MPSLVQFKQFFMHGTQLLFCKKKPLEHYVQPKSDSYKHPCLPLSTVD